MLHDIEQQDELTTVYKSKAEGTFPLDQRWRKATEATDWTE